LEYLARQLVDLPDQVTVKELEGERCIILELRVAPEDMGKVIGRQGKTAQAIRTLVKAAGLREGKRVMVEIL
ncbi:MAG: KH domain-containing protein, partial [bacterium]|nr:KH domain-containing protein [bacterium]